MTARLERILVGVDGSDNGTRALEWAMLLARQGDAEVIAVHAIGLLAHLGPGPGVPSHAHLQELRQTFETEWCAPLRHNPDRSRLLLSNILARPEVRRRKPVESRRRSHDG